MKRSPMETNKDTITTMNSLMRTLWKIGGLQQEGVSKILSFSCTSS